MKLPGIDYTVSTQMTHRRSTWADGLQTVANDFDQLAREDAEAESHKLWAEARNFLSEGKQNLTESQYREDENGNLVSRHHDLMGEYERSQEHIKKNILGRAQNTYSRQILEQRFLEKDVADREEINIISEGWAKGESRRAAAESITDHLNNERFDEAERVLVSGLKGGYIDPDQGTKIAESILGTKQYVQNTGVVASARNPKDFQTARKFVNNKKNQTNMTAAQVKAVNAQLDQRVEDNIVAAVRDVVESRGIKAAEAFVRKLNKTDLEMLGYADEDGKYSGITRAQQVVEDYRFGLKQDKEAAEAANFEQMVLNSQPMDRKKADHKKAMDSVFKQRTEGIQINDPEYQQVATKMTNQFGWVPPKVMSDLRANLDHSDPANNVAAADALLAIDASTPRAVGFMDDNDIALAVYINTMKDYGVPSVESIAKMREGIQRVPDAKRKQRAELFNREIDKESSQILTDLVEDGSDTNPWNGFAAQVNDEMRGEFNMLIKQEFLRVGNKEVAAKLAYRTLRGKWSPDTTSGDRTMRAHTPAAVLGEGKETERIEEQVRFDLESIGADPETHTLERLPGQDKWLILGPDLDVKVDEKGNVAVWDYDRANDQESKRQAKEAAKQERQRQRQMERAKSIEGQKFDNTWEEGLINKGLGALSRGFNQDVEWAADGFEFLLKDIPDGAESLWDKMPHNRDWAKKARGESYNANKE